MEDLIKLLEEKNALLQERERELADKTEELSAQREELTAAVEELMAKNKFLSQTMNELRDRNFELDQILYRTSHDIQAPLSSIKGIINLSKLEPQSQTLKEYWLHIEMGVTQMNNLLKSLSSLSKSILEEPDFSTVRLDEVSAEVIASLSHLPSWNHIKVIYNLQQSRIKSDPFLITIIFQSLLSNAFIFRDPHKTGTIVIQSTKNDSHLLLEVSDDGDGINPFVLDHIFEMFYRGSEKSKGNGLGLYIAKKATERLKGRISVSFNNTNTVFTVELPLLS